MARVTSCAHAEVVLHLGAAEVDVAILEAHLFVGDGFVGGREWRRLRFVEEQEFVGDDLDLAGGHVGVAEAFAALADGAFYGDDVLVAGGFGLGVGCGADLFVEDDLGDAAAVADVEEDEVAVVAAAVDPAHEDYVLASLLCAEIATHVRPL